MMSGAAFDPPFFLLEAMRFPLDHMGTGTGEKNLFRSHFQEECAVRRMGHVRRIGIHQSYISFLRPD
jgi:hypothetical protein